MSQRHVVVKNVPRSPTATLQELAQLGVATVHEAQGRVGFLGPDIRPIQGGVSVAGNAVTVLCPPGDNMMIHAAIEVCRQGDLLVVANTAPSSHGMFGELLATSLMARGVVGLVIDAGVRDTPALRSMGFPVWSRYVSPLGTDKATPGSVNVPVTIGEANIRPGDVVCADDDGAQVIPHEAVDECLTRARARAEREEVKRAVLRSGALTMDIDGLRQRLIDLGVEFLDESPPPP